MSRPRLRLRVFTHTLASPVNEHFLCALQLTHWRPAFNTALISKRCSLERGASDREEARHRLKLSIVSFGRGLNQELSHVSCLSHTLQHLSSVVIVSKQKKDLIPLMQSDATTATCEPRYTNGAKGAAGVH